MKDFSFFGDQEEVRKRRGINMIPLINIAFLLLMFFMLTTSFISNKTIQMNISPEESSANNFDDAEIGSGAVKTGDLKVYIKAESIDRVKVNEKEVDGKISEEIKRIASGRTDFPVVLETGKELTVQEIIAVIEEVQKAGTNNITIF